MSNFGPIVARGEIAYPGSKINLTVKFKDGDGNLIDTDFLPTIQIIEPSGHIIMSPTSAGVARISQGLYSFLYEIGVASQFGVYSDVWTGIINGFRVEATFNFQVNSTQTPGHIHSDGYLKLGDKVGFNYDQSSIFNINKILEMVKARLNSSGMVKTTDASGNSLMVSCDIYSTEILVHFIAMSLSKFNSVPFFTMFTFSDSDFFAQFGETIAEGAVLYALASQALIERGREFQLTDNGINFNPPAVSELLNTQYNTELQHFWEYLRMIKASMRPGPKSLGVFNAQNGGLNPAIRRLRTLRARQIF